MADAHELPGGLAEALAARSAGVVETWCEDSRGYLRARAPEGPLFARWSDAPEDADVLAHERAVRAVVEERSDLPFRVPGVVAHGRGWVLEQEVEARAPVPSDADGLVAAAFAVESLELPPAPCGRPSVGARRPARLAALARSPLPLRDVLAARRITGRASPHVTSHGDFHPGNVLVDGSGAVWVVDWELSRRRAWGYDVMQLAATLPDAATREAVVDGALAQVGFVERASLLRLRYALLVETIARKLVPDRSLNLDPDGAAELLRELPAVRRAARA